MVMFFWGGRRYLAIRVAVATYGSMPHTVAKPLLGRAMTRVENVTLKLEGKPRIDRRGARLRRLLFFGWNGAFIVVCRVDGLGFIRFGERFGGTSEERRRRRPRFFLRNDILGARRIHLAINLEQEHVEQGDETDFEDHAEPEEHSPAVRVEGSLAIFEGALAEFVTLLSRHEFLVSQSIFGEFTSIGFDIAIELGGGARERVVGEEPFEAIPLFGRHVRGFGVFEQIPIGFFVGFDEVERVRCEAIFEDFGFVPFDERENAAAADAHDEEEHGGEDE